MILTENQLMKKKVKGSMLIILPTNETIKRKYIALNM